jgi:hypothetical protein
MRQRIIQCREQGMARERGPTGLRPAPSEIDASTVKVKPAPSHPAFHLSPDWTSQPTPDAMNMA